MEDTDAVTVRPIPVESEQALTDWQRMHAMLRDAEKDLARLSALQAQGCATAAELDAASEKVIALRELSLAVLARLRGT
jgi:multidrug resistance efflux pump